MRVFDKIGIFGRTYALLLGSVFLAEGLLFALILGTRVPNPPVAPFDTVVRVMSGAQTAIEGFQVSHSARPALPVGQRDAEQLLEQSLSEALHIEQSRVHAKVGLIGPPSSFGMAVRRGLASHVRPLFVSGDVTIECEMADGQWRSLTTDPHFFAALALRLVLLVLSTFIVIVPFAYVLARRVTGPISQFAHAADRLGRNPQAAPLPLHGTPEIRRASQAFNLMQQRITRYVEDRTSIVAAMAHDLGTPLMRLAFLNDQVGEPVRGRIQAQIDDIRIMTDAVLSYLRDERARYERVPVALAPLIEAVCENAGDKRMECLIEGNPVVLGDPLALRSVFGNLIDNALKYGGSATVMMRIMAADAHITVTDQGPGLALEERERVFQPFYRVEHSRNRATGGIGLGLAVVRSNVLAHGGTIALDNHPAGGLVATVTLPLFVSGQD